MSNYLNRHCVCDICSYKSTNIYYKSKNSKKSLCLSCYNNVTLQHGLLLNQNESNVRYTYLKTLEKNQLALELITSQ